MFTGTHLFFSRAMSTLFKTTYDLENQELYNYLCGSIKPDKYSRTMFLNHQWDADERAARLLKQVTSLSVSDKPWAAHSAGVCQHYIQDGLDRSKKHSKKNYIRDIQHLLVLGLLQQLFHAGDGSDFSKNAMRPVFDGLSKDGKKIYFPCLRRDGTQFSGRYFSQTLDAFNKFLGSVDPKSVVGPVRNALKGGFWSRVETESTKIGISNFKRQIVQENQRIVYQEVLDGNPPIFHIPDSNSLKKNTEIVIDFMERDFPYILAFAKITFTSL